jgi:pyruvate/2-oxoglutarate dehydrogenase complex dihydrolipoamide acyltransferase (E2) component
MPTVIMPKMGDAMEEGTLLRWLKEVGQEVAVGEPIAEIETDKVALEIEANDGGVLTKTLVGEGETVPIGTPIATIGEEDAAAAEPAAHQPPAAEAAAPATNGRTEAPAATDERHADADGAAADAIAQAAEIAPAPGGNGASGPAAPSAAPVRAAGERLRASPLVKRLAAEHGIDLDGVTGTGPVAGSSRTISPSC